MRCGSVLVSSHTRTTTAYKHAGVDNMAGAIDFRRIAPRTGSQEQAFEEFCCQIARHCATVPTGSEFVRYRGAGGDGGVECVWRLPNGDEWGWQAKYIFDLRRAKASLDDSAAVATKIHPRLRKYTICLPFDLTGPTGRKGRSQQERFEGHRSRWIARAGSEGVDLQIPLLTPSSLLDELHGFDVDGGRLYYWFDETVLNDHWFAHHLEDARKVAGPRYSETLRLDTPLAKSFNALGRTDQWFLDIKEWLRKLGTHTRDWERRVSRTKATQLEEAFPDHLRTEAECLLGQMREVQRMVRATAEAVDLDLCGLPSVTKLEEALALARKCTASLADDLREKHGAAAPESEGFRQYQSEYMLRFPAADYDTARELEAFLEGFRDWLASAQGVLPFRHDLLVLGDAGVGKTHAVYDAAVTRKDAGLRSIVLFGEQFSDDEPWHRIALILGLRGDLSREALLMPWTLRGRPPASRS